ncbi:TetR/AcrR family transcriptional regulator [Nocardia terpenica]|uniref:TetR family transcriptional regulator n=1 Tax=Nocardia terpenica TaxID=455432 RepID=A0A164I4I6_9NOCA|nr:TetR/AcrR family transcriptional regulator [Nocardia terpenica]KZM69091.1 TetR family transcriptional regulator [Nocardia terpenica]NQE87799.1 TetR/AcrR family transcriptional regulator [Nocardia terpenica]
MVADRSEIGLASARPDSTQTVRRRPKNRKAQIVRVAARAFSERGYHPVGVDEIAAEVGISGPALYRHFTNKYALLVAAAESGAQQLLDVARGADDPRSDPESRLTTLLRALAEHTIEVRREGGLYRWERRYLEPEDRGRIRVIYAGLHETVEGALAALRPETEHGDIQLLATGALGAIGSVTAHRTALSTARLTDLLQDICWSIVRTELPPAPTEPATRSAVRGLPLSSKREQLLTEAIRIFGRQGYHESSIEEIGAAVGINASSVYRYFTSKSDLLAAAFHRTGERLAIANAEALSEATSRDDAALRIADRFARLTFAMPEILPVYFAEFSNLPAAEQHKLRSIQRQNVLEWAHLLDGDPAEARFRVHAAIAQVIDAGRGMRFDTRPESLARLHALMKAVLLGPDSPDAAVGPPAHE